MSVEYFRDAIFVIILLVGAFYALKPWWRSEESSYVRWRMGLAPVPDRDERSYMLYLRWNFRRLLGDAFENRDNITEEMRSRCMEFIETEIAEQLKGNHMLVSPLNEELSRRLPVSINSEQRFDDGYLVGYDFFVEVWPDSQGKGIWPRESKKFIGAYRDYSPITKAKLIGAYRGSL